MLYMVTFTNIPPTLASVPYVIVSASLPRTAAFINVSMAGLAPVGKGDEWRQGRYCLQSGYIYIIWIYGYKYIYKYR